MFNTRDPDRINPDAAAFQSVLITPQTSGRGVPVRVDIAGAKKLYLVVDDGGDGFVADHFNWSEPRLVGPQGERKLTDLPYVRATAGWGQVSTSTAASGKPMRIDGKAVAYGIGTHSTSVTEWDLPPGYTAFKAFAGLDDGGVSQGRGATVRALVFTRSPFQAGATRVPVSLGDLGLRGAVWVRDLWQKKDIGDVSGQFAPDVAPHGARLLRLSPR